MVRLISRQRGGLAALKLTKLFGINDFPAAKDCGKVLIIIIYCYLINYLIINPLISRRRREGDGGAACAVNLAPILIALYVAVAPKTGTFSKETFQDGDGARK